MTVTKSSIIQAIRDELDFSGRESVIVVECLLELIKRTLEAGDDLMLDARRVVSFKCSGKLRKRINAN